MEKYVKTAISMHKEDFALIEKIRKDTGKNRSQVLMDAFHTWWKAEERKEKERQYEAGYQNNPLTKEELSEMKALIKSSEEFLIKEGPWNE